jgi:hypothetical protein
MASLKASKNWRDIFDAPKRSESSFTDIEPTVVREHDSFSRFAKSRKTFQKSSIDIINNPEIREENFVDKIVKKLQVRMGLRSRKKK